MCGSTCLGHLSAHHQERTTALGASGFTVGELRLECFWKEISGVKKGEVTGSDRKFHIDELRDLYSSSDIIRATESRRMGGGGGRAFRKH